MTEGDEFLNGIRTMVRFVEASMTNGRIGKILTEADAEDVVEVSKSLAEYVTFRRILNDHDNGNLAAMVDIIEAFEKKRDNDDE